MTSNCEWVQWEKRIERRRRATALAFLDRHFSPTLAFIIAYWLPGFLLPRRDTVEAMIALERLGRLND